MSTKHSSNASSSTSKKDRKLASTGKLKSSESGNKKRDKKQQDKQQSNKGLIGSAMTLSVVGMLNYMGQQNDTSGCFVGEKNDQKITDRDIVASDYADLLMKDNLSEANDGSHEGSSYGYMNEFAGIDSDLN